MGNNKSRELIEPRVKEKHQIVTVDDCRETCEARISKSFPFSDTVCSNDYC